MTSCGNPETETQALMEGKKKYDKSDMCIKCKTNRGNIVVRHAVYCKDCFLPFVTHKFRRSFEPFIDDGGGSGRRRRHVVGLDAADAESSQDSAVLVGVDGSVSTAVLLDLLTSSYFAPPIAGKSNGRPRQRRPWKRGYVCYVEVCGAFADNSVPDRSEAVRAVLEKQTDLEFVLARVEDAFDPRWWQDTIGRSDERMLGVDISSEDLPLKPIPPSSTNSENTLSTSRARLRAYLAALPTQSAAHGALSSLIRSILLHTAARLKCTHVALGTTLTSLSISLLTSVAYGAGAHVPEAFSEEWVPPMSASAKKVRVVRPLQDIGAKDCAAYVRWKQLPVVPLQPLPDFGGKSTIGGLTSDFIVGLERDYPSTVSAIVRTCAKLAPKDSREGQCVLCGRPYTPGVLEWKARISIRNLDPNPTAATSTDSSDTNPDSPKPIATHPDSCDNTHQQPNSPPATSTLSSRLCYACHTHLTSRAPRPRRPVPIPVPILGTVVENGHGRGREGANTADTGSILPMWTSEALLLHSGASSEGSSPGTVNGNREEVDGNGNGNGGGDEAKEVWQTRKLGQEDMRDTLGTFLLT